MKLLLCFIGLAMPFFLKAQQEEISPLTIGERIPDMPLPGILNYKDTAASLSSFGNKLIILDYWNEHCINCIKMFPIEDSLQVAFANDIQFILVTDDDASSVQNFLKKYKKLHGKALTLPIMAGDKWVRKLFRFLYIPHYIWIAPNGVIIAESSSHFISSENIANSLLPIRAEEQRLKGNKYADINLKMKKPEIELLRKLSLTDQ